jgi:hypothetical protein
MLGFHGGYSLNPKHIPTGKIGDDFYRGYCCDRPIEKRLYEHCQGIDPYFMSDKEEIITAILEDPDYELIIQIRVKKELYEPFDEEEFIQEAKNDGITLTNRAVGGVFQPYVLIDGKLVRTEKGNQVELRSNIQDWKRNKKKPTASKSHKPATPLKSIGNNEFIDSMKTVWDKAKSELDFDSFCAISKAKFIKEYMCVFTDDPDFKPFECDFKLGKRLADPYRDKVYPSISL